jgi:hypothetical protein
MSSRRQVDDGQPCMCEARSAIRPSACVIGPAMTQRRNHGLETRLEFAVPPISPRQYKPGDAAHLLSGDGGERQLPDTIWWRAASR